MLDHIVATVAADPLEQAFAQARQGSREARLAYFDTYGPVFLKVIRAKMDAKLRSAWDSADFMQDCRLDLLRQDFADLDFETPQAFLAYLLDIAKGGVLQTKRKMQRQKRGGGQADKPLDGLSQAEQEQLADKGIRPANTGPRTASEGRCNARAGVA